MNDKLTQREGFLRAESLNAALDAIEQDLPHNPYLYCTQTIRRMALYALNGPPAVDLDKVREALQGVCSKLESQMARNPGLPEYYKEVLAKGFKAIALLSPPAPTDHKESHAL